MPAPNIAHLLLGFDINKSLRNQRFFNPGTKINYAPSSSASATTRGGASSGGTAEADAEVLTIVPRNCLHSIIRMLNRFLRDPIGLVRTIPSTIELSYEILFALCSNSSFNQQLLSYLRQVRLELINSLQLFKR